MRSSKTTEEYVEDSGRSANCTAFRQVLSSNSASMTRLFDDSGAHASREKNKKVKGKSRDAERIRIY